MFAKKKRPADLLDTVGNFYEVTVLEDIKSDGEEVKKVICGELRGWVYDDNRGLTTVLLWEVGDSSADEYYDGDILDVKPMERPVMVSDMFFTPYKGRAFEIGQKVDVYRNLHTNNGYSIRDAKTGLVLAHCSTVQLTNARFHVSESGRQKTVSEKRKRVHAFVRGTLAAYNVQVPSGFKKVIYNPYYTTLFTEAETKKTLTTSDEVVCSGKYAYVRESFTNGGNNGA
ncbi:hypothetical protein D1B31_18335 [Neobacillus notoginsengisoli]|uniref:Uncharacterized protein n=1 Tax=Neobacillus notoginsengisoli TaxID=1578198 RepID=A0A417YQC6_9BACI|nr:hypothetical protein [Neobacillus notoginsengisoli]RHW36042.1 hypothetical protein D1B31_18335 [Neobacillus notoginsengisoli]